MLMSLNICQLVLIHRPLEARPCSVADREKMAIDALSLLVRRSARSEGTEWISEEGVAAGPPREPSVDIYSHPFPDLWQVDGWQKADFDWTRNEMLVGSPVSHRAIDGCSLMCLVQSVLQQEFLNCGAGIQGFLEKIDTALS